jgi:hypothetical protein
VVASSHGVCGLVAIGHSVCGVVAGSHGVCGVVASSHGVCGLVASGQWVFAMLLVQRHVDIVRLLFSNCPSSDGKHNKVCNHIFS